MRWVLWIAVGACGAPAPGFFVTSDDSVAGGDLGGLAGADRRCSELALAAGLPDRAWRAYLSTSVPIDARDRIGEGPWYSVDGTLVASDVDALHQVGPSGVLTDELGNPAARGPSPGPAHDIFTGSTPEGRYSDGATCDDWTSSSGEARAIVGHHDWRSMSIDGWEQSWNAVHGAPCDLPGMQRQLGTGRLYCFAAD